MAVERKITIARILAVRYGIAKRIYASRKFWLDTDRQAAKFSDIIRNLHSLYARETTKVRLRNIPSGHIRPGLCSRPSLSLLAHWRVTHSCQQSRFERDSHDFEAVFTVPPDRHFHQRNVPTKPKSTTITFDRQDYHYRLAE